ncbi:Endonuclease/exonuclease/phosphatase [Purpureocillium lavendulum]|uniref:Endonuclease/exonuclease/phosphatase n=1 Tax=Purpureocillium lavendulum TaxID=1247861 RepID=A0AB34FE10_9HYPO|nr:Endonuclease/exonuclease/phosphatase [Purpureocillium lavendulum]
MSRYNDLAFELPKLRSSFVIPGYESDEHIDVLNIAPEIFDIKFCPYQPLDCKPVFAAVGTKHVSSAS